MTFSEYVLNWFEQYLDSHTNYEEIFQKMRFDKDKLDEPVEDFLKSLDDADVIYNKLIKSNVILDDLPDSESFLLDCYKSCYDGTDYSFVQSFTEDMAYHSACYNNPVDFFKDLAYGGCVSGLIGMLVYHSDCKKLYIEHIDDMEAFISDIEEDLGEPVINREHLPHYTFVCWVCYEEMARDMSITLFPDEF